MKFSFSKVFTYLFIFFIISVFFIGLKKSNIYDTKNLINQKINDFKLPALNQDSVITDFNLTKNNYTLINFWASWCLPCRDEHIY